MAGSYPDVPSNRLAYDTDGTQVIVIAPGQTSSYEMSAEGKYQCNDESLGVYRGNAGGWGESVYPQGYVAMVFERLMDIRGGFHSASGYTCAGAQSWQWSADTNNGIDGTWAGFSGIPSYGPAGNFNPAPLTPEYRTNIGVLNLNGVRGIKFWCATGYNYGWSIQAWHMYGTVSAGQNTDRLEIWHPTLDQRVGGAYFDWGNAARTTTEDKLFRVKNLSDTLTANTVSLFFTNQTESSPTFSGMHTLSTGGSFSATASVGTLFPGQISSPLTLRRSVPSNGSINVWVTRLNCTAASWT